MTVSLKNAWLLIIAFALAVMGGYHMHGFTETTLPPESGIPLVLSFVSLVIAWICWEEV